MTNNQLTREWLQGRIANMECYGVVGDEALILQVYRIATAAMDSEPVKRVNADQMRRVCLEANRHLDKYGAMAKEVNKLLGRISAQPAPVVPYEVTAEDCPALVKYDVTEVDEAWARGFNACRAAMLQDEPVTTANKLPPNSFTDDQLEGMAHGNNPQSNAYRELLAYRRNSPVIPDTWIPVSERMPEVGVKVLCFPVEDEPIHASFNGQLWLQDISWSVSDEIIDNVISCNVTHWMPLPAAPQEVNHG